MNKRVSRIVAAAMLVIAVIFVLFALNHPEMGFPWGNGVTYTIYGVYTAVLALLFAAPWRNL